MFPLQNNPLPGRIAPSIATVQCMYRNCLLEIAKAPFSQISLLQLACPQIYSGSRCPHEGRAGRMPTITVSRRELYNEVWTTPMVSVSRKYGLSDAGRPSFAKDTVFQDPIGATGPRRSTARPRQRSCHVLCSIPGALAPSMRHTHRVNA